MNMGTPSILTIRKARVSRVHRVTPELFTLTCVLEHPQDFAYQAGQWVYLHLMNESGESVARGAFSLASAPAERRMELEFGIKIYGRLTTTFSEMRPGDLIGVQGPFGVFTLPSAPAPLVFLAGGIGITPFRSMVREALETPSAEPIALIWMEKMWEDLMYHHEFEAWQKASHGRFLYRPALTRDTHPDWTGWRGHITKDMFESLGVDWSRAHAYVCGPNRFMDEAKILLKERGIEGRSRLHEERYS